MDLAIAGGWEMQRARLVLFFLGMCAVHSVTYGDWDDWWTSPAQRVADHVAEQKFETFEQEIDFLRALIIDHTEHNIDEWHEQYAFNTGYVTTLFWKRIARQIEIDRSGVDQENTVFKPHLSCGPRAYLMQAILGRMKARTRVVYLLNPLGDSLQTHTFLDVSKDGVKWQVQDPDLDLYYVNKATGQRLATWEVVLDSAEVSLPCHGPPQPDMQNCSWNEFPANTLPDYFRAAVYDFKRTGEQSKNWFVARKSRFDADRRYPGHQNMTLTAWVGVQYGVGWYFTP